MPKAYTEHEKKISKASKAWRNYQWICSDEYAQDMEDRHILIAEGDYTGRPPVPLQKQKERALQEYKDALEDLRRYERQKHLKHMQEDDIKDFVKAQGHENKGRKRGGRAIALQKYIRRIERQIEETKEAPESDFVRKDGRGRPPMSRLQKVRHYERLVEKARAELIDTYSEMSEEDRIWHEMHDLKTDRRQLRLALRDPDNNQSSRIWRQFETAEKIEEALTDVNTLISKREAELKMIQAGIELPKRAEDIDPDGPHSAELYRRTLEHMIKEQKKIQKLEEEARKLGIDVSKLKN
ncbi:hypothetical protein SAMN04487962_12539 [Marinobacter segnicrescens]|uniref:MobA/MobL family protein n=1 Tax=Marinobacter segnicrescens TaxID=430453 RepID=A0A1I0H8U7_9GAMM|nr:hypothetical protein [Marinobacter segnicrescens]SET80091.1 hypothetical protein SAMN04487962_12539 [Marinobacter segnicrescens]